MKWVLLEDIYTQDMLKIKDLDRRFDMILFTFDVSFEIPKLYTGYLLNFAKDRTVFHRVTLNVYFRDYSVK